MVQRKQIARPSGRKRTAKFIAEKALRLASKNNKTMEVKSAAASYNSTVNNTGVVELLSGIAEGTDYDDRIGKKITLRSVQIRGHALNNDTTLGNSTIMRLLIVRDNTLSGSAPAISDILLNTTVYSVRNPAPEKLKSYTVLYDKSFDTFREKPVVRFSKYKKLGTSAIFDGATVADVNKGSLYAIMLSNRSSNLPTFQYQTMIKYVDQ